jgi:tetratricopeptide (TPR) repeat protein
MYAISRLRPVFAVSLLLLFSSFVYSQVISPLPSNFSRQVTGQVRYMDSKQPADNVHVRIESFAGGVVGEVFTDRMGKFSFSGLSGMQYNVTIRTPGFQSYSETVNLVTQNSVYLNILLIADGSARSNTPQSRGVIDSNIPMDAQKEYFAARDILDQGKKDKIKDAIPHLEKALSVYPKFLDAQLALGLAYMDLEQFDKAEAALKAALDINKEAATAYLALGQVYTHSKNYEKAAEVLVSGLTLNDKSTEGHYLLASAYWEMAAASKDQDQIRDFMEKAWKESSRTLELDPNHAKGHLLAGNLLLRARRGKDALTHFEKYLSLEPKGEFAGQVKTLVDKLKQALAQSESEKAKKS